MNRKTAALLILLMALCAAAVPAASVTHNNKMVQGEVLDVREDMGFDQMTMLTTRGEMMEIRLGEAGWCQTRIFKGDQVRVHLTGDGLVNGSHLAQSMKLRRTGSTFMFRDGKGQMYQHGDMTRARNGSHSMTPGESCPGNLQAGSGRGMGGRPCGGGGGRR